MTTVQRYTKLAVEEAGWESGTTLENQVAWALHRSGIKPGGTLATGRYRSGHDYYAVAQQYRVGRFRVDFAWPDSRIALEADGWWHRSPEGSAKDAERDSWLRSQGWLVFRVDDRHGEDALGEQLAVAVRAIRLLIRDRWR